MSRRLFILAMGLSAAIAQGQNFQSSDTELRDAAERARLGSAMFWTGEALPGNWSQPCPITLRPADHTGGGRTRFTIREGQVFGWDMLLEGRRDAILQDVLPHEVDHAVRASLVRRPIVRWLDEGCATLMESPASHQRLREQAIEFVNSPFNTDWFDAHDYPPSSDARRLRQLYTVGFSIVEYLLEQAGPTRLLAFQNDTRPPSRKLADHYSRDVDTLVRDWRIWLTTRVANTHDCNNLGCVVHTAAYRHPRCDCGTSPRNLLTIWSATWCGPCRRFWDDFNTDPQFRTALLSRYHLHALDLDRHRSEAARAEINAVPTFVFADSRIVGYHGKSWLLEQLDIAKTPTASPTWTAPLTSQQEADGLVSALPDSSPRLPHHDAEAVSSPETPSQPVIKRPVAPSHSLDPLSSGVDSPDSLSPNHRVTPSVNSIAADAVVDGVQASPSSRWSLPRFDSLFVKSAPIVFTAIQLLGLLGGTAATGGVGALVLRGLWRIVRRRRDRLRRRLPINAPLGNTPISNDATDITLPAEGGGSMTVQAPFPRRLDEARQLLSLRHSEGRVAVLDTLRGMFLDDELQKLTASDNENEASLARRLRNNIDTRVDEVAPLSTTTG